MSNPSFKQKFDEYTPRYFTSQFFQPTQGPISPEIPDYPAPVPPFDYRLLRMELFYQIPFQQSLYEIEELEMLKTLQANVVHEIMYHFTVSKKDITIQELEFMSRMRYPEPRAVLERRLRSPNQQDFF